MRRDEFVARYGGVYEKSPWVAERAFDGGVMAGEPLAPRFRTIVERAGREAELALLRAHPDLAGRIGVSALTAESAAEQQSAGLDQCTAQEAEAFLTLNAQYTERFGFPFILAVRGKTRAEILSAFRARVGNEPDAEFQTALGEVHTIARLRLDALDAPPPPPRERVPLATLRALTERALERAGADAPSVAAITDTVMAAEAGGNASHGMFRVPGYCNALASGLVAGAPTVEVRAGPDAVVRVDGGGGFAPVAYTVALPALAERASQKGAAVLALTNSYHLAAMWHEVAWLAGRGFAAFACTANFAYLAPHGGALPVFGTNPIAFAYPYQPHPVVFDFAASAMARGDILLAKRDGRALPIGMGVDAAGAPTTDPDAILAGAQLPFGGPFGGHKGSAIALMVELLCGGVCGDVFSHEVTPDASGAPPGAVFVLALAPDAIGGAGTAARGAAFLSHLAAVPGVRLPGARRHQQADITTSDVPTALLGTLRELAGA